MASKGAIHDAVKDALEIIESKPDPIHCKKERGQTPEEAPTKNFVTMRWRSPESLGDYRPQEFTLSMYYGNRNVMFFDHQLLWVQLQNVRLTIPGQSMINGLGSGGDFIIKFVPGQNPKSEGVHELLSTALLWSAPRALQRALEQRTVATSCV